MYDPVSLLSDAIILDCELGNVIYHICLDRLLGVTTVASDVVIGGFFLLQCQPNFDAKLVLAYFNVLVSLL